ncbi:MAG TPA: 5-deoxy-glucuronate isomerase [Limnochordia bacterium]
MALPEPEGRSAVSLVRRSAAPSADGTLVSVSQAEAGWEYVSFQAWRLRAGRVRADNTAGEEIALLVLSGEVSIHSAAGSFERIGGRSDVFSACQHVVYLPPATPFEVRAVTDCEVARCAARAERGVAAYQILPEEIGVEIRGAGSAQRSVRHVLEVDRPAERLLVVEVITPAGHWSSYPPHKHDRDDPPREAYLEEIYYHRVQPRQGFAFQRVYTSDRSLDEAIVVEDGTVVLVPRGYHPVAAAPGYELYYLNVMAGPRREWQFQDDPDHHWVAAGWRPYGQPVGDA